MEFLYSYVKNICVYLLVITIIINIFPERRFVKYIKLFAGILLIIIVISPFTNINKIKINMDDFILKDFQITEKIQLDNQLTDIENKMEERIKDKYGK